MPSGFTQKQVEVPGAFDREHDIFLSNMKCILVAERSVSGPDRAADADRIIRSARSQAEADEVMTARAVRPALIRSMPPTMGSVGPHILAAIAGEPRSEVVEKATAAVAFVGIGGAWAAIGERA